jgi:hypothetical protein
MDANAFLVLANRRYLVNDQRIHYQYIRNYEQQSESVRSGSNYFITFPDGNNKINNQERQSETRN